MGNSRSRFTFDNYKINRIIKYIFILLLLAIVGNLIYILATTKTQILSQLINFKISFLILALIMSFVPWFTQSTALILWTKLFGKGLKLPQAFKTVLATEIGGAIAPIIVGGGYVKFGFLLGYGLNASEATLVTFLGTMADGIFFLIALPLAIIMTGAGEEPVIKIIRENLISHWQIALLILIILVILFLVIRKYIYSKIRVGQLSPQGENIESPKGLIERAAFFLSELWAASKFVARKGKTTFLFAVMILGVGWICRYGVISMLVLGMGLQANPILLFLLQWVVFSAASLLPTPGGVGGAELSFALVYEGLIPSELIPVLTGAWRFMTFYILIIIDAIVLAIWNMKSSSKNKDNKVSENRQI